MYIKIYDQYEQGFKVKVKDSKFLGNYGGKAGALFIQAQNVHLENVEFDGNTAEGLAGAFDYLNDVNLMG